VPYTCRAGVLNLRSRSDAAALAPRTEWVERDGVLARWPTLTANNQKEQVNQLGRTVPVQILELLAVLQ
jgi:hypothetical protein